jgi:hypothetical protein
MLSGEQEWTLARREAILEDTRGLLYWQDELNIEF